MTEIYLTFWPQLTDDLARLQLEIALTMLILLLLLVILGRQSRNLATLRKAWIQQKKAKQQFLEDFYHYYHQQLHQLEGEEFIRAYLHYLANFQIQSSYLTLEELLAILQLPD